MEKTTFSWRNYYKATPQNLERIAASARRMVAVVAGASIVMDANKWIPLIILVVGALLDEMKNFFAVVAYDIEQAEVKFPSGEEITVIHPIKKTDETN